jgi:hypothetical protein
LSDLKGGGPEGAAIADAVKQLGMTRVVLSRVLYVHATISADMELRLQVDSGSVRYAGSLLTAITIQVFRTPLTQNSTRYKTHPPKS